MHILAIYTNPLPFNFVL